MNISINMPDLGIYGMNVSFAVDTGASRTIIGHRDALSLSGAHGVDLAKLPTGRQSLGIGGLASLRQTRVSMRIGSFNVDQDIPILEPIPGRIVGLPSLLGRDILSHFALLMEERTSRVLLLEPAEADSLRVA
ncbi:MAG: hypothetical protein F4Z35_01735 [Dehalococcoidia bacterium]|nr:hypothetical protein [Dehalococcoidia bacterium]